MLKVGLIGLGAIGRVHYEAWRQSQVGKLVAVSDRDRRKLAGDWAGKEFNIGEQTQAQVDLSDLAIYDKALDLIANPEIELVDICMPTPLHAPLTVAALQAGKHVFCEKPMSLRGEACAEMEAAAKASGRHLMIGHCLRFWPQYVKAHEILTSGEYGRPLYAEFHRFSPAPVWSDSDWYMKVEQSGGVFDMHIHDIDVALWWFGRPTSITTSGLAPQGLPMVIDTAWHYEQGPLVQMHASWDRNGGTFRHAFKLIMEKGTLVHDLAVDPQALHLLSGSQSTLIPVGTESAYAAELEYFATQIATGQIPTRTPIDQSRLAVEIGREELRQIGL